MVLNRYFCLQGSNGENGLNGSPGSAGEKGCKGERGPKGEQCYITDEQLKKRIKGIRFILKHSIRLNTHSLFFHLQNYFKLVLKQFNALLGVF